MLGARLLNITKALALVLVIPIVALVISYFVSGRYDSEFKAAVQQAAAQQGQILDPSRIESYRVVCSAGDPQLAHLCGPASHLRIFEQGALLSVLVGLSLFVVLLIGRLLAGANRKRLAMVLSPLTRIILLGLSISIVLQGALFVYGLFIAESVFLGSVHFIALAAFSLAALIGGLNLVLSAIRQMRHASIEQTGVLVDQANGQRLINLVNEVADNVGARRPDNIMLGLEPSFYVTGAKLSLNGSLDLIDGTTLYMPLPFLRILTEGELRSVIGHEMGHFKGQDTEFSMKFYPAYSRLGTAIYSLSGDEKGNNFLNVPTLAFLVLLHAEFSGVERKIGRQREIVADREGAAAGSAKALATALLKFSEYTQVWWPLRKCNADHLNDGQIIEDLSDFYVTWAEDSYRKLDFASHVDELLASEMAHPNDTHPTLRERLIALQIEPDALSKEDLAPANNPTEQLIDGYAEIAERLTISEHNVMTGVGWANWPARDVARQVRGALPSDATNQEQR